MLHQIVKENEAPRGYIPSVGRVTKLLVLSYRNYSYLAQDTEAYIVRLLASLPIAERREKESAKLEERKAAAAKSAPLAITAPPPVRRERSREPAEEPSAQNAATAPSSASCNFPGGAQPAVGKRSV